MKLSQTQWFIVLWLGGFFALALVAGAFRLLVQLGSTGLYLINSEIYFKRGLLKTDHFLPVEQTTLSWFEFYIMLIHFIRL